MCSKPVGRTHIIVLVFTKTAGFAEGFGESILGCAKSGKVRYGKYLTGLVMGRMIEDETILPVLREDYFALVGKLVENVTPIQKTMGRETRKL